LNRLHVEKIQKLESFNFESVFFRNRETYSISVCYCNLAERFNIFSSVFNLCA